MIKAIAFAVNMLALEMADFMLISVLVCGAIGAITGLVVFRASKRKNDGKDDGREEVKRDDAAEANDEAGGEINDKEKTPDEDE